MGKRKAQTQKVTDDNKAQSKTSSQQQKKSKNNRTITKKSPQKKATRISDEDKKINYVLNPKKIREKMMEVKEMERREKEKSYQTQKKKRNSAFLRTTSKGQPVLGARMKVLYNQIQKSFGSGK